MLQQHRMSRLHHPQTLLLLNRMIQGIMCATYWLVLTFILIDNKILSLLRGIFSFTTVIFPLNRCSDIRIIGYLLPFTLTDNFLYHHLCIRSVKFSWDLSEML